MMRTSIKSGLHTVFALQMLSLALLGISGCGLPNAVLWLPDSSGIIFSEQDGSRLVQFDLSRQASRVIVRDTNTNTPWPALRSDGKRVAVAKVEQFQTKDSDQIIVRTQVLIYDLNGRLVKESSVHKRIKKLEEPSSKTECTIGQSALNWAGPPSKIIVYGEGVAIYDCVKDNWLRLEEVFPWPFGNMPVRPDGEGFVAGVKGRLCFVDWAGWISEFDLPLDFDEKSNPLIGNEWNDDVFRLIFRNEVLEFNTSSMKASRKKKPVDLVRSDDDLTAIYRFDGNVSQLCLFTKHKSGDSDSKQDEWKLEIQIPTLGKRKVLFTNREYRGLATLSFFPSPDKKKVALELVDQRDDKRVIVVIDDSGEILATVKPD